MKGIALKDEVKQRYHVERLGVSLLKRALRGKTGSFKGVVLNV